MYYIYVKRIAPAKQNTAQGWKTHAACVHWCVDIGAKLAALHCLTHTGYPSCPSFSRWHCGAFHVFTLALWCFSRFHAGTVALVMLKSRFQHFHGQTRFSRPNGQTASGPHFRDQMVLQDLAVSLEANIEERGERQLLMQSERRLRAKTALQWPHLRRAKKRNLINWPGLSIATVHWDHWGTLILYISKIWFPHGHFAQAYWASAQQRETSSTQAFHNLWVWAFTRFSFENLLTPRDAKNVLKFLRQELSCILPILDLHAEPAQIRSS